MYKVKIYKNKIYFSHKKKNRDDIFQTITPSGNKLFERKEILLDGIYSFADLGMWFCKTDLKLIAKYNDFYSGILTNSFKAEIFSDALKSNTQFPHIITDEIYNLYIETFEFDVFIKEWLDCCDMCYLNESTNYEGMITKVESNLFTKRL